MTALAPCPHCKRHVATHETACPFCARAITPGRARHVLLGHVSRAAVFSAALAACDSGKAKPPPPAPPAQGSDDLEKLLDQQPGVAVQADAATADAGVPDAGVPDAGVRAKEKQNVQTIDDVQHQPNRRHMAKPYGAPPARRRVV